MVRTRRVIWSALIAACLNGCAAQVVSKLPFSADEVHIQYTRVGENASGSALFIWTGSAPEKGIIEFMQRSGPLNEQPLEP